MKTVWHCETSEHGTMIIAEVTRANGSVMRFGHEIRRHEYRCTYSSAWLILIAIERLTRACERAPAAEAVQP